MISLSTWHIIRASGLTAYMLLFLSASIGMLLSARVIPPKYRSAILQFHKGAVVSSIVFSLIHAVVLLFDKHSAFTLAGVFIPFSLGNDPSFATAMGILSFYFLIFVAVTSVPAITVRFGREYWKYAHYLSWPCFMVALYHGLLRGTDSSSPYIFGMYAVTGFFFIIAASVRIGAFFPVRKVSSESASR